MVEKRIVTGLSVVIEQFPGVYSLYYHLSQIHVEPGRALSAGTCVGSVGSTGLSTGAHLHLGLFVHGIPCDPAFMYGKSIIKITR